MDNRPSNGARDERNPQAALRRRRKSGAVGRSAAKSERSEDFRSIEQLGGGEVAPATSHRYCSMVSRPIRRDASAASVSPNVLRQLPGGFVALNLATPNPTMRVRDLDLRAD
jgi:hypothetical protein